MRLTSNASLAFKRLVAAAKAAFGANVVNCLNAIAPTAKKATAALFPDLPVPTATLEQINNTLLAAVAAKVDGGRVASEALKTAVADWDNAFTLTAKYVSDVAQGDRNTIVSAGFIPTKDASQSSPRPGAIEGFKASINGRKGAIIAGTKKKVSYSKAFVTAALPPGATIEYADDTVIISMGESSIYLSASTRGETEMYNLPSAVPYNVSMFAINSAGNGPASATLQVIPQ